MKQKNYARQAVAVVAIALLFSGCANQGEMSDGTRKGAKGGALVGLTLGAMTGDAKLAAAGAVAGGMTGGMAGNWSDYEADRQDYRVETIAGAIASKNTGGQAEAPASWQNIDAFVGQWQVNMWGLDDKGQRVDATATATSSLDTTKSVSFRFSNFQSSGFSGQLTGTSTLGFKADRGFEMLNNFSSSPSGNRYVGHYDNMTSKYEFFYAGSDQDTYSGVKRTDYQLVMRMIGNDVIVIETWALVGSEEKRIQSYRFTRKG